MRRSKWIGTLVPPAIGVAVLAGCGGGSNDLGAAELVTMGDSICSQERERFDEIQAAPLTSASVGAEQAAELLEVAEDAQAKLRDLEPPEEIRGTYDRSLDARDRVSDLLAKGKEAAEDKDGAAYGKAQEAAAADAPEREKLARDLGFRVCSQAARAP
jgi:hypothetical protein